MSSRCFPVLSHMGKWATVLGSDSHDNGRKFEIPEVAGVS